MSHIYVPDFVSKEVAVVMFHRLWNDLSWEQRADAPRMEYWANDFKRPYTYGEGRGERTYVAQKFHDVIVDVRDLLEVDHDVYFEGCFLNGYKGSRDWLGWHSDNDEGIDHSKPIAIVTLYEGVIADDIVKDIPSEPSVVMTPRVIHFREKDQKEISEQPLGQGSLCLMPAGFQQSHEHKIPKAGFNARKRISLTFRSLL